MEENKSEITQKLFETLKVTRFGRDIKSMEYVTENSDEYVIVTFDNDYQKRICVTADSGRALIKDVVEMIGR